MLGISVTAVSGSAGGGTPAVKFYPYDFLEAQILSGSTGRFYYKSTLEMDHLTPAEAVELVPVYSEYYLEFLAELERSHNALPDTESWAWDGVVFVDETKDFPEKQPASYVQ